MGISSALYSGVSGLKTNSHAMSVIGNNLAHTNTVAFKGARTVFSDLLSSSVAGSGGQSQIGRGVNLSKVDNLFTQGTFESTESGLDVAIEGEGFFMLKEPGNETTYYSRAGAFRFDENGYLVNPEGFRVQGQQFNVATGQLTPGDPSEIRVTNTGLIEANATTLVTMNTNLDASSVEPVGAFNYLDPTTYNYSSSTQVFDSLGNTHLVTVYFRKTGVDNTWNWYYSTEDANGTVIENFATPGTLTFDAQGNKTAPLGPIALGAIDWLNGSENSNIELDFNTTQYNSASVVISQDQNGFGAGDLTSIDINEEGIVVASYSNGEQINIAQLTLAKFQNPGGLQLAGSNMYLANASTGAPRIGLPGPELGKIFTNSLEQSNVDMGTEFVRLITTQRGFQANSKIITTVDELLNELINLKR
ncbi:flagellar hook protein FlgE [Desulfofustis limnaeus]|uniref:Flagellar hook protein FlgE n=1 Tax=Desulfofustis limnaeus TaxID=2740163 RepID=A0ABN6M344_9BACT|nr:flagellar hook protein FlgE [Desulfofustis limnaeus]BDD87337.1 flagellar hook protein FlgE [Desulfofustis limnaeus]